MLVTEYLSIELPLVNEFNIVWGYLVLSDISVHRLLYLSYGKKESVGGLITVPSSRPLLYTNLLSVDGFIVKETVWVICLVIYLNDNVFGLLVVLFVWTIFNFICPFLFPFIFSIFISLSLYPSE